MEPLNQTENREISSSLSQDSGTKSVNDTETFSIPDKNFGLKTLLETRTAKVTNEPQNSIPEGIQTIWSLITRNMPKGVKGFFQTLIECLSNHTSWNKSKVKLALQNASDNDKKQIIQIIVQNFQKFDTNIQILLLKKPVSILKQTLDILGAENFSTIITEGLSSKDKAVRKEAQSVLQSVLQNASEEEKVQIFQKFGKIFHMFDTDTQSFLLNLPLDILKNNKNLTENEKKILLECTHQLPFKNSLQAEIATVLEHPDLYARIQKTKNFDLSIECDDIYLTRNIEDPELRGKREILDSKITENLFDENNDQAFEDFYEVFEGSLFHKDVIKRASLKEIQFGDHTWIRRDQNPDEDQLSYPKNLTTELLNTILQFCDNDKNKACEFLSKFIKQQHCSGNCLAPIMEYIRQLIADKNFENWSQKDKNIWFFSTITPNTQLYNTKYSLSVNKDWNMYSSADFILKREAFSENDSIKFYNGLLENFQANIPPLSEKSFGIVHIETKIDLKEPVHEQESDVAKDMQTSAFIKIKI